MNTQNTNAYGFSFKTLNGNKELPLTDFKDKVLLVVNTASNCGFTKQYEDLQNLYLKYKDKGLVILGIPSNDFGEQEPGDSNEIENFCKVNFGVTFPLASKEVVVGKEAHPFYIWAKEKLGFLSAPKWNFHKYLIDKKGNLIDYFVSTTAPNSDKVIKKIEKYLNV